jgi:hypothetical protein
VEGGIDFCAGVYPKRYPKFVAGTVKVFPGTLAAPSPITTGSQLFRPSGVPVSQVTVGVNQEFWIALPPGQYVLEVGDPWLPVGVSIVPGATAREDIPGSCK